MAGRVRDLLRPAGPPALVGVAGPVAVGKSTFASTLRDRLAPAVVEVVATDGFLRPNDELAAAGLLHQKGFPATYDTASIGAFLADLRRGRPAAVPVYSHETYDRVTDQVRLVDGAAVDAVVLEGVNALQPEIARLLDLRIYVDAEEPVVRGWYVTRFLELTTAAETDEASFYRRFVDLDEAGRRDVAEAVWEGVNLVNLVEHIRGTCDAADVIVVKGEGHTAAVVERPGGTRRAQPG